MTDKAEKPSDPFDVPLPPKTRSRAVPRKPSDLLRERGALLRHSCGPVPPTIEELMRHAEKFGTECVVETAAELGYTLDACVRLADHCDRTEAAEYLRAHPRGRAPKADDSTKRCKLLLGIEDPPTEVANV